MRARHTTLRSNLPSILLGGLLTSYSRGKKPVIWIHDESRTAWAYLHAVKRHGGRVEDVVSLEVDVPDDLVRRSAAPGLFYVVEDVSPDLIGRIYTFLEVAKSPIED